LGDAGVGKSSIANQYFNEQFKDSYEVTIGGVYFRKDITLRNGTQLAIHLWDTGGEERYRAMAPL
jgi:small GTP-binding protein